MNGKILLSVVLAFAMVGVALVAFSDGSGSGSSGELVSEVSSLRAELAAARSEMNDARSEIVDVLRGMQTTQSDLAEQVSRSASLRAASTPIALPGSAGEEGEARPAAQIGDLQGLVAAILQEERRVESQQRDRQREEFRQRADDRRKQVEAMSQGPYDRYNLKVNSLGSILGLDDNQKQAYFELSTAYREKLENGMKSLREQAESERQSAEGEAGEAGRDRRRGGRGREGFEKYRELRDTIDKEFQAEVGQILSAQQLETYNQLSRDARSFSDRDEVRAPGDDSGGRRGFGGDMGGRRGGFGGFGGGRGRSR